MSDSRPSHIGPYEIEGVLGEGAMGVVYKARQPSLGRTVAVKVLPEGFSGDENRVERFNREAQAVAMLSHPNVVQIIEKGQDGDILYFAMEYVSGVTLEQLMKRRRLSVRETLTVMKAVCRGLEAAHAKDIIHRDLNPKNVLVSDNLSTIKLADFGISRIEAVSRELGTLSTAVISLGTLHYVAPEQAASMSAADHRSDIYSAGVLFYEMLTGRVPVGRFNLPSQINNEVPPEIDPVVLKCLESRPADRYPRIEALLQAIQKLEDRLRLGLVRELEGISTSTTKILLKPRGLVSRLTPGLLAAILLGLLVVGSLGALLWKRNGAPADAASEPVALETDAADAVAAAAEPAPSEPVEGAEPPPQSEPLPEPQPEPVAATPPQSSTPPAGAPPVTPARPEGPSVAEMVRVARDKAEAGLADAALEDLALLIAEGDADPALPAALLAVGEIEEARERREEALEAYVELRSRFPAAAEAAVAGFRQAALTAERRGRDNERAARDLYLEVAGEHPQSPWAPRALAAAAVLERELKLEVNDGELGARVPAELVSWRRLVTAYPDAEAAESALWELGEQYEDLKRYELAAATFAELGRRFPGNGRDAWWRAGQLFERRLDDRERAREAYANVPEGSRRHRDAQRRLSRLD